MLRASLHDIRESVTRTSASTSVKRGDLEDLESYILFWVPIGLHVVFKAFAWAATIHSIRHAAFGISIPLLTRNAPRIHTLPKANR